MTSLRPATLPSPRAVAKRSHGTRYQQPTLGLPQLRPRRQKVHKICQPRDIPRSRLYSAVHRACLASSPGCVGVAASWLSLGYSLELSLGGGKKPNTEISKDLSAALDGCHGPSGGDIIINWLYACHNFKHSGMPCSETPTVGDFGRSKSTTSALPYASLMNLLLSIWCTCSRDVAGSVMRVRRVPS